jgi:hypothetical protein
MATQVVPAGTPTSIIVPPDADKDSKYWLNKFATWLASSGPAC